MSSPVAIGSVVMVAMVVAVVVHRTSDGRVMVAMVAVLPVHHSTPRRVEENDAWRRQ